MAQAREIARAFAPATVANVGCGFDVLGFALERPGDVVEARRTKDKGVRIAAVEGDGGRLPREAGRNTAGVAASQILEEAGSPFGVELSVFKQMPLASGLGSSAASAVAGAVAVNALLGGLLPKHTLLKAAARGERAAVGTAHADNVAPSLYGGFVLVREGGERIDPVPVPTELFCALLHPHLAIDTAEARAILPETVRLSQAVEQWGNVAALVAGLATSNWDLIGSAGNDVIVEPIRKARVPGFDAVKAAALDAGALVCSLSGSGPSIFAFCRGAKHAEKVARVMQAAFAHVARIGSDTLVSRVGARGARILTEEDPCVL
jgi:homoserine kinase